MFLSLIPSLLFFSLLVQLARDLQSDFYPHFQEFFSILVSVCNVQDADLIQVCVCVGGGGRWGGEGGGVCVCVCV